MGLDAQLFLQMQDRPAESRVRRWSYELGDAFGHDWFWRREGQHNLSFADKWQVAQYLPDGTPGTILACNISSRYYGPGYERGPLPVMLSIARWLDDKLPEHVTWYGSDLGTAEVWDEESRQAIWRHFTIYGHRPYTNQFTNPDHEYSHNRVGNYPFTVEAAAA